VNAGIEVLVVEDEASLKRSLTKYLERAGYTFECCATAREALALAERHVPGIVIAEYLLPDANGAGFLEKLVRIVPDVAVILLSEYDFQAVSRDLAHVAVGSFLKKPFDLVEFEAALSSARSKVGGVTSVDLGVKREHGFDGVLGFIPK
jgi:DNA-binding NtrC family response regulator